MIRPSDLAAPVEPAEPPAYRCSECDGCGQMKRDTAIERLMDAWSDGKESGKAPKKSAAEGLLADVLKQSADHVDCPFCGGDGADIEWY